MESARLTLDEVIERARTLTSASRKILGITGAPGAGKSTVAQAIVSALGSELCAFAPMDGFHLSNATLAATNKLDRKGAIDTFDVSGYVALLTRIKSAPADVIYAPDYYRKYEESIGSALPINPSVPLVVTEGNYLLASENSWGRVSALLDECWFIDLADEIRIDRLIKRHIEAGKSPADAERWATGSDQRNAESILALRSRADLVITLSE
jgi:pantothenate kinase